MGDINREQEQFHGIVLFPDFTKNINQIHYQNTMTAERITVLYELGSNNNAQVMDDLYAVEDERQHWKCKWLSYKCIIKYP
jgi:hypothetical protein